MQTARSWRAAQAGLVLAYVAAIAVVLGWEHGRRAFWTCAIASLPLVWVALGFHAWRRVCPLATLTRLGARLAPAGARPPRALVRAAPLVQLGLMIAALAARHAWLNGDRVALAAFLVALAGAALVVGARWAGRAWCHTLCPVGLVERIYTEPDPAPALAGPAGGSGCLPCTGCVSRCADLDPRRSHLASLGDTARAVAWTAWPGVVLAFYLVFFLEAGSWEGYVSGAWAYEEVAPAAWPLAALVLGGAASAALLLGLERLARALGADPARARHCTLVAAGGLAFCAFYAFAGQPTLLVAPLAVRFAAAAAVALAAARLLVGRWRPPAPARRPGRRLPLAQTRWNREPRLAVSRAA